MDAFGHLLGGYRVGGWPRDSAYQRFKDFGEPELPRLCEWLQKEFSVGKPEIDLLCGLLCPDPQKRLTASQALDSTWFDRFE